VYTKASLALLTLYHLGLVWHAHACSCLADAQARLTALDRKFTSALGKRERLVNRRTPKHASKRQSERTEQELLMLEIHMHKAFNAVAWYTCTLRVLTAVPTVLHLLVKPLRILCRKAHELLRSKPLHTASPPMQAEV
jgi:hypothetical protein